MKIYAYWFLLAFIMLALEMATGTFYILVMSVALAIGGLVALAGLDLTWQLTVSALAGIIGILVLQQRKRKAPLVNQASNPDVGEQVSVLTWRENGKLRVYFRGTEWDAELASSDVAREQALYIKATRGSTLILTHLKP